MDFPLQVQYAAGLVLLVLFCNLLIQRLGSNKKNKEPPQPSGALPIIGHLHLMFRGKAPLAQILRDLGRECGPLFMLRLGLRRVLVVNSVEGAKDCFFTHDKAFASRPSCAAFQLLGYDYAMFGFAPYGPYWRSVRKVCTIGLLSNTRLEMLKHVRSTEVDVLMKDLYGMWVKNGERAIEVDLKKLIGDLIYNVAFKMVVGKRYYGPTVEVSEEGQRFKVGINQVFRLTPTFVVSDAFPFLKWFDFNGTMAAMKSTARDLDSLIGNLIEEHRHRRATQMDDNGDSDFIDVMLSSMEDSDQFADTDQDKVIKATCLVMILGGAHSVKIFSERIIEALLSNEHVFKNVVNELNTVVGRSRLVEEYDMEKLVYLQAIMKETLRISAAIGIPHQAIEDCQLQGYHVPAGTPLFLNAWAIHNDPELWPNPTEFKPERFLSSTIDIKGQHFELVPFGSGRRACPGISYAWQVILLIVSRLIQGFELQVPCNTPYEATSQSYLSKVMLTPCLSPSLYI